MKTITFPDVEGGKALSAVKAVVEAAQNGATVGEQRKRLKLLDVIEKALKSGDGMALTLEDEEHERLKALFEQHRWPAVIRDVVRIGDAIDAAKTVDVEKVAPAQ